MEANTDIDYTSFDIETLLALEAHAAENLLFYRSFKEKLIAMDLPQDLIDLVERNEDCIRDCETQLDKLRKAIASLS